jgi:ribosomal-protein-alanine N-acetyltransferase
MFAIDIRRLGDESEIAICAQMMAASEPWITLGRDYDASYQTIADPIKEVYVAVVDEQIAGFLILNMSGGFVGYIQSICVAPHWRGHGIGTQLIQHVETRIFSEKPNAFICVSSFNPDARRLYAHLGYQLVGELHDYVVQGYSEFLLRKTIGPLRDFHRGE